LEITRKQKNILKKVEIYKKNTFDNHPYLLGVYQSLGVLIESKATRRKHYSLLKKA
jgi:hypothetical protein